MGLSPLSWAITRCLVPKIMKLVLSILRLNLLFFNHSPIGSKSSCTFHCNSCWFTPHKCTVVPSAYIVRLQCFRTLGRSLIITWKRRGPNIEPCGTPANVFHISEKALLQETFCDLLHKYDLNQRRAFSEQPTARSLQRRMYTRSYARFKWREIAQTIWPISIAQSRYWISVSFFLNSHCMYHVQTHHNK